VYLTVSGLHFSLPAGCEKNEGLGIGTLSHVNRDEIFPGKASCQVWYWGWFASRQANLCKDCKMSNYLISPVGINYSLKKTQTLIIMLMHTNVH
jgi:hypothetical protein